MKKPHQFPWITNKSRNALKHLLTVHFFFFADPTRDYINQTKKTDYWYIRNKLKHYYTLRCLYLLKMGLPNNISHRVYGWFMVYGFTKTKFRIGWLMVFNATFNNISVISWRSVLLEEETEVPGENHRPVASH
jgi:hypothetical protein